MATLTSLRRKSLSAGTFGIAPKAGQPGKYPMPDRSHAANAKARATQQVAAGNLSPATKAKIDAKANRVLGKTLGSQSNSMAPNTDMLHPTDRAIFAKRRR